MEVGEERDYISIYNIKNIYLIADIATGVEIFYFREQIQTVIKPHFYSRLCQLLMKIIPVIN